MVYIRRRRSSSVSVKYARTASRGCRYSDIWRTYGSVFSCMFLGVVLSEQSSTNSSSFAQTPSTPRIRIYIYPLPDEFLHPCNHFGCGLLERRLRASEYVTEDPNQADYYWIPHQMPFKDQTVLLEMFAYIKTTWPYWNISGSQARHILTLTCDHGPGDCSYHRPILRGKVPDEISPISPERRVIYLMWNGMRDGFDADPREEKCNVCFQKGKDVQLVTAEGVCGPLCGYKRDSLSKFAVWSRKPRARHHFRRERSTILFYGGSINPDNPKDSTGRAPLYIHHHNRSGYRIINTRLTPATTGQAGHRPKENEHVNFAQAMSESIFCFSPLGKTHGDTDRYVAALMMGCIPVMLKSVRRGRLVIPMAMPLEEHPYIDWTKFSVQIDADQIPDLHNILSRFSMGDLRHMRHEVGKVWQRMLYTTIYQPYLGEDGQMDAFESLMDVLHARLK